MPYRRLPNTDKARMRAIKTALQVGKEMPPNKLAFSSKSLLRLQKFLPLFEQGILMQRHSMTSQAKKSRNYTEVVRKAKVYLTHFIRVMNMAIYRGELPVETRAFYGLATNESTVPSMNNENELYSWGKRIIDGEEFRIKKGGSPITNPTIAVVKVRFEQFKDALNYNNTLAKRTLELTNKNSGLRKEADEIILEVWNEIENHFANIDEQSKRISCEEYGLVYFYRKSEIGRNVSPEPQTIPVPADLFQESFLSHIPTETIKGSLPTI